MKRLIAVTVATLMAVSLTPVFAGDGCCAAKKVSATATATCSTGAESMCAKLNLTEAQKTKLTALQDRVKHATSTSEGKALMEKGLAEILTPEQLAQCKEHCEKTKANGGSGCPFAKSDKK